jgi:hypothetical protein
LLMELVWSVPNNLLSQRQSTKMHDL